MAVLYITEYADIRPFQGGLPPVVNAPPVASQTKAIGGTTAQSNAFNDKTRYIRVHTDVICSIEIGANPTATTGSARMAADQTEYFAVLPGHKVAVITNS